MNDVYDVSGLPKSFKATLLDSKNALKLLLKPGMLLYSDEDEYDSLIVEFIGWSRIDGDPMFNVKSGRYSLGHYFVNDKLHMKTTKNESTIIAIDLVAPRLISLLEDNYDSDKSSKSDTKEPEDEQLISVKKKKISFNFA